MSAAAKLAAKFSAQKVGAGETAEILKHPASDRADKVKIPDGVAAEVEDDAGKEEKAGRQKALTEVVARFNEDHFVSVEGGKTAVYREAFDHELGRERLDRIGVDAFRTLHNHETVRIGDDDHAKKVGVADAWLKHAGRRTYVNGLVLLPEGETPAGTYNLWRGFGCEPKRGATQEEVKPALAHMFKVVCGADVAAYNYLLRWLAWGVQNPGKQAEVAVVLQGGRGVGKGFLGRWFRDMYGAHGMHIQHPRHLVGNFNGHLQSCCAMFVDEAFFAGDRAGNAVLKSLITEDQMTVEKKGIDVAPIRNRLKILMATNEDHAIIAGTDERRYFVLHVSDAKAQDHTYFGKLDAWWVNGGKEALLGYLLDLDLKGFNIRSVPNTAALERQKIESLDVFNLWVFEKLSDGNWHQDRTPEQWAGEFFVYAEKRGGTRYVKTSTTAVGMRLREAGIRVEKVKQTKGDRKNVWVVPDLAEARRMFAAKLGLTHHQWGEGEDA